MREKSFLVRDAFSLFVAARKERKGEFLRKFTDMFHLFPLFFRTIAANP